jgi:hypothetical protein
MIYLELTGSTVFPLGGAEHGLKWRFLSMFKRRFPLFGGLEQKERYRWIRLGKLQCKSDFRFGLSCWFCFYLNIKTKLYAVLRQFSFNKTLYMSSMALQLSLS